MSRVEDQPPPPDLLVAKALSVLTEAIELIHAGIVGALEAYRELVAQLVHAAAQLPAQSFTSVKYERRLPPWRGYRPPTTSEPIAKHVIPEQRRPPSDVVQP